MSKKEQQYQPNIYQSSLFGARQLRFYLYITGSIKAFSNHADKVAVINTIERKIQFVCQV